MRSRFEPWVPLRPQELLLVAANRAAETSTAANMRKNFVAWHVTPQSGWLGQENCRMQAMRDGELGNVSPHEALIRQLNTRRARVTGWPPSNASADAIRLAR
jgi:hypothetical protein